MDQRGSVHSGDGIAAHRAVPPAGHHTAVLRRRALRIGYRFLFLGSFILAAAIQRWEVDQRIAWSVLRLMGTRRDHIIGGMMAATAFLSMWVSNTVTAAMMLPIAMAYAASPGGIGTLIGSPPNSIAARFIL